MRFRRLNVLDITIEVASIVVLLVSIFLLWYYYPQMPEQIIMHFNALGEADSYGDKENIITLAKVNVAFYLGLTVLSFFPGIYNYPVKVTNYNKEYLFPLGIRFMRVLKLLTTTLMSLLMIFVMFNIEKAIAYIFIAYLILFIIALSDFLIKARRLR